MLMKRLLAAGIVAGLAVASYGAVMTMVLVAGPPHSPVLPPKPPTCSRGYVATQLIDPKTFKAVWKCLSKI